jgi:magnesium transporter
MSRQENLEARVLELIREDAWERVAAALGELHPADIADVIERSPRSDYERVFSLLKDEVKPRVLAELEHVAEAEVVESLSNSELSDIVEEMAPDDAADVLADLDEERSQEVLELMEEEESEDVRKLLEYAEDTAGGIMTTDVVAMREDQTVAEALEAIAYLDTGEEFLYANVVDENGRMTGYTSVWELLRERNKERRLGELAHGKFAAATVDMDQEKVAYLMGQYDLSVLPVVDALGKLVGRITADDVIDVIEEEASEDIFRLAGSDDAELESPSPARSCAVRLPWLLITLGGGFLTSFILGQYHSRISDMLILGAFVPIVLAMGGNTGIQSSTLIVRSIALGELKNRNVLKLLLREIATGAIMGCICGLVIGIWAHFLISQNTGFNPALSVMELASVVSVALFSAMTFAAVFGAFVPIVLHRAKIDPAVASGPFITITNDISALLIYFGVTIALLRVAA